MNHYNWIWFSMSTLPFTAFVGLEELKKALLVLAVDNSIEGLLIMGPKGTGKSSIVRAMTDILPEIYLVSDCPFNCDPYNETNMCDLCKERIIKGEKLPVKKTKMKVITLPIGATEDMVLGTINIEKTLQEKRIIFEPGILGRANRNILYIDEVNLLPDHIVDSILDAAASGWNIVEREGISLKHPAKFILIGTMNPEEGELRPQLLDRFAISVKLSTIKDPNVRAKIVKRNIEFQTKKEDFLNKWEPQQKILKEKIEKARKILKDVQVDDEMILRVSRTCALLEVDGYRPDIVAIKVARALAALDDRLQVTEEDLFEGLRYALTHRTRAEGLKAPPTEEEISNVFYGYTSGIRQKVKIKNTQTKKNSQEKFRFFPRWSF